MAASPLIFAFVALANCQSSCFEPVLQPLRSLHRHFSKTA
jgi:hypothetical protein